MEYNPQGMSVNIARYYEIIELVLPGRSPEATNSVHTVG